jgi:hypothetical protein
MYELDGQEYSLEEIQKAAEQSSLTVEEYIQQTGIVKTEAVAEEVADVTAINEQIATGQSTDLGSENISLDLEKINNISQNFSGDVDGGITTDETPLTEAETTDLTSYIDELEKQAYSLEGNELTQTVENLAVVFENLPGQLKGAWEDTKASSLQFIQQVAGDDAADFITGKSIGAGAIAYIDPETNEEILFKNNPEKWKQLSKDKAKAIYFNTKKEIGSYADQAWIDMIKKSQKLAKEQKSTGAGFVKGFREGDISDVLGASFNAVGGVISTMVPAVLTRGASLAPQIAAPMITNYNVEKAKSLYGDVDDALEQLQNNNEIDLTTPAILATFAVGAEYIGIKNIGKIISRQAWNLRGLATTGLNVGVNGFQESIQFGLETTNKKLAQGVNLEDAIIDGLYSTVSDEGLDAFLSGLVGSAVVGGGGNKALRALRNDSNGINLVNSSVNKMHALTLIKNSTKDKRVKAQIEEEIQNTQSKLKTYLETNQKLSTFLNENQKSELISLIDKKDKLYNDAVDLRRSNQKGDLSNNGYGIRSINNQAKKIDRDIQLIKKNINVEQVSKDIETAKKVGEKLGFAPEVLNSKQFEARIEKLGFSEQEKNEALLSEGFITPKGEVLINKDRAVEVGAIGVASHELLHRIVQNDLSDPTRRAEVVNDFKKQLSKKELDIVQKRIDENYKFNEDGTKKSESEYNEEYLTAFSDALRSGEISYEKTLFEKLAEPILKIFRPKGFTNASFKDGKDVYNFLKEYQRELSKGKLTQRAEELSKVKATKPVKEKFSITEKSKEVAKENKTIESKIKAENKRDSEGNLVASENMQEELLLNNMGKAKQLAQKAYDAGQGLEQNKRVTFDQFFSGYLEQLNKLTKTYKQNKNVKGFGAYMMQNLERRYGTVLKEAKGKGVETQSIDKSTMQIAQKTSKPVSEKPSRVRKTKELSSLEIVTPEMQQEFDVAANKILSVAATNPNIKAENLIEALNEAASKIILPKILKQMGDPNSSEYSIWHAENYNDIVSSLSIKSIKKRYSRSKPKLFNFKPIKREKDKKVNPITGKITYPGKTIFEISASGKGQFGSFFLNSGRNNKTRQQGLGEEITESVAQKSVTNFLDDKKNIEKLTKNKKQQEAIAIENELNRVEEGLDKKTEERRSFDKIKFSKTLRKIPPIKSAEFARGYNSFIKLIKSEGATELAVENAMNKVYGSLDTSMFTKTEYNGILNDFKTFVTTYKEAKENYKANKKPSPLSLENYISKEVEGGLQRKELQDMLGLSKGSIDFNNSDQLQDYSNSIVSLGQHLVRVYGEKKAVTFMVNMMGPALTGASKTGSGKYTFNNDGILVESKRTDRSNSLRYSLYENQNIFANVVLKNMVKDGNDITFPLVKTGKNKGKPGKVPYYKGNKIVETKPTQSTAGIKEVLKGIINYKNRESSAKKDADALLEILDWYKDRVNDTNSPITANDAGMMLRGMNGDMRTILRTAANLKYIPDGKLPSKIASTYEWEHTIPARVVVLYAADYMNNGNTTKEQMETLMDQYHVSLTPKSMDDVVGRFNKDSMRPGWRIGDNWATRYYNINTFGAFPFSLKDIKTGKILPISKNAPQAYKNVQKAKVFNENIVSKDTNIKFSKTVTNEAVLNKMETLDKDAQDARIKFSKSKDLNKDFNDIIERATGIGTEKRYGQTKARAVGADKGKFNLLGIPPSAQDFVGLTRYFAGKGKKGDETIAWIKENFLDPFARANIDISNARVALANDFKALKQLLGVSPKDLNKKITGEPYTVGNAVRVYTWVQQGMTIPGLSKADQKILEDYVTADENLVTFANELIAINKDNGYPKPQDSWLAGTITTDLLSGLNTVVRAKYLKQWQGNVNEVFNETNLNKLEAAYGKSYREALENILGRMKSGSNRGAMGDSLTGRFVDWLNGSIGAIMFFNMRSAVLQTISAVNFVNWSDNNPLKAAAAFGNQPQYWSDVIKLMNSDYLVERRNGLKINVNEADIAEIAAESKNKAKAFISKLLKLGFLPTQIADSFAIASGGATFYRNRLKSLIKDGMSQKEAEAQAFQDFREIAEESQQSSRPDRISAQQAGPMGRVILAFANTPAQYARLMQKAASDIKNRRGDDKTNISKILYYGAIQNVIFNALQQALFAMAFDDEEPSDEAKNKKYTGIVNGMSDSLLRGLGFHGAAISSIKNAIIKLAQGGKAQDAAIELLDISPPISSKIGKLKSAGRTWDWNKKEIMEKGFSLDNPAYLAAGQVVSAATNVPLDRGIRKLQNLKDASDAENEEWIRVANALGWAKWELEWKKDKKKKKSKKYSSRSSSSRSSSSRSSSRNKNR